VCGTSIPSGMQSVSGLAFGVDGYPPDMLDQVLRDLVRSLVAAEPQRTAPCRVLRDSASLSFGEGTVTGSCGIAGIGWSAHVG
jgi:hypothetical protein